MSIKMSPDITAFSAALLAFQAETTGVVKNSTNPHFKKSYASLAAVVEEARPVLQRVGISWMQAPGAITAGNIGMTTLLMHAASGQWVMSDMDIPLGKQDPQGAGSAITYAQRYSLMASLGLPPVDDDAESAMPRQSQSAPMTGRNAPPANGSTSNVGGAALSEAYKIALGAMKMSRSRTELRNWFVTNKENIAASMPENESLLLVGERNTLALTLPEHFSEAAE